MTECHLTSGSQSVRAGNTVVNCGAATLNGQTMGSDEAYNFVFKGEYMFSCLLDSNSRYILKGVILQRSFVFQIIIVY